MRPTPPAKTHRSEPVGANLTHSAGAGSVLLRGWPDASVLRRSHGSALSISQIDNFVFDCLMLIGAFMRIDDADLRRKIVMLVQEIAGNPATELGVLLARRTMLLLAATSCWGHCVNRLAAGDVYHGAISALRRAAPPRSSLSLPPM